MSTYSCTSISLIAADWLIKTSLMLSYLFTFLNAQLQPHSERVMNEWHVRPESWFEAKQVLEGWFFKTRWWDQCFPWLSVGGVFKPNPPAEHLWDLFKYLSRFIQKENIVFAIPFCLNLQFTSRSARQANRRILFRFAWLMGDRHIHNTSLRCCCWNTGQNNISLSKVSGQSFCVSWISVMLTFKWPN